MNFVFANMIHVCSAVGLSGRVALFHLNVPVVGRIVVYHRNSVSFIVQVFARRVTAAVLFAVD